MDTSTGLGRLRSEGHPQAPQTSYEVPSLEYDVRVQSTTQRLAKAARGKARRAKRICDVCRRLLQEQRRLDCERRPIDDITHSILQVRYVNKVSLQGADPPIERCASTFLLCHLTEKRLEDVRGLPYRAQDIETLDIAATFKNGDDFARLENRNRRHSVDDDRLRANELGFELRFAIFEQHRDHFS